MVWFGHHHDGSLNQGDAKYGVSSFVIAASAIAYGLTLALNAVAARLMPAVDYGEFSSAVAMIAIVTTCATLGLEKYALRVLPEYLHNHAIPKVKGYVFFGACVAVVGGLALGVGGYQLYGTFKPHAENTNILKQLLWFIPGISLFLFIIEVVTTFRSAIGSTLIYRIILPAGTLAAMMWIPHEEHPFKVADAVAIYGGAWMAALLILVVYTVVVAPNKFASSAVVLEPKQWLTHGFGYLGLSLVMTLFGQSAILILEIFRGDRTGVARLSACMQIAGLAIITQTAMMRVFAPALARLIASGDLPGEWRLVRKRGRIMLAVGMVFTIGIVLFGRELLGLFGEDYRSAYPTLVLITVGNVINIVLGAAPVFLQFHGRHRLTLGITAAGTVFTITAIAIAARFGDYTMVAQAYVGSLIVLYVTLQIAARRLSASLAKAVVVQ